MRHVSDIIFPRRILYKESNYCAFVFILASLPHCLFPATAVAQDLLMSLSQNLSGWCFLIMHLGKYQICLVQLCHSMIRGLCFSYFKVLSPIVNISSAMCCVSLKPETLCALGYLDLCLQQLSFIRGIEFRIFTVRREMQNFSFENVNQ